MSVQFPMRHDDDDAPHLTELRTFRLAGRDGRLYAVVAHDPARGLISDFWAGAFADRAAFRAVLEFIAERFEAGGYRYWLADLRFLSTSFADSRDWLVDELMPRVFAAGLVREAVVLPENQRLPADYDVFRAGASAVDGLGTPRVRGFTDLDEAKRWLLGSAA